MKNYDLNLELQLRKVGIITAQSSKYKLSHTHATNFQFLRMLCLALLTHGLGAWLILCKYGKCKIITFGFQHLRFCFKIQNLCGLKKESIRTVKKKQEINLISYLQLSLYFWIISQGYHQFFKIKNQILSICKMGKFPKCD